MQTNTEGSHQEPELSVTMTCQHCYSGQKAIIHLVSQANPYTGNSSFSWELKFVLYLIKPLYYIIVNKQLAIACMILSQQLCNCFEGVTRKVMAAAKINVYTLSQLYIMGVKRFAHLARNWTTA